MCLVQQPWNNTGNTNRRQEGESQNGGNKKTKQAKFFEKRLFLLPDTRTYVCVSRGQKFLFFKKFDMLFLVTSVLKYALLRYYQRNNLLIHTQPFDLLIKLIHFMLLVSLCTPRTCAYQGVINVRFSESLTCFVSIVTSVLKCPPLPYYQRNNLLIQTTTFRFTNQVNPFYAIDLPL